MKYLSLILIFSFSLFAENKEMTLEDFMDHYTKPAIKLLKKKQEKRYLEEILKVGPSMAPEKDKSEWEKITQEYLTSGDLEGSCKACHKLYKKEYQKTYSKRFVVVPEAIVPYKQELQNALK